MKLHRNVRPVNLSICHLNCTSVDKINFVTLSMSIKTTYSIHSSSKWVHHRCADICFPSLSHSLIPSATLLVMAVWCWWWWWCWCYWRQLIFVKTCSQRIIFTSKMHQTNQQTKIRHPNRMQWFHVNQSICDIRNIFFLHSMTIRSLLFSCLFFFLRRGVIVCFCWCCASKNMCQMHCIVSTSTIYSYSTFAVVMWLRTYAAHAF